MEFPVPQGPAFETPLRDRTQHLGTLLALQHQTCRREEKAVEGSNWGQERAGRGATSQKEREQAAAGLSHHNTPFPSAGNYLSSVLSGMPASRRAARNCVRTPRMLLMKPLESGKRGKPMSG